MIPTAPIRFSRVTDHDMHCVTGFGVISRGIGRALDLVGNLSVQCTIPVYIQDA